MTTTNDKLVFVPLGGVGEIGMNLAMYGYGEGKNKKWIVVDFGISFPGPHLPGVDVLFADIQFLEDVLDDVVGLIVTHAHEDHYGAILELWPGETIPIFATAFTDGLLKAKAAGFGEYEPVDVNVVKQGETVQAGPFSIEFIAVSHSIPEPCALLITTDAGRVLHTGDWKLDPNPGVGAATNIKRLTEIGETGGVDVLVCDSTNAMREGDSPSEKEIEANLTEVIKAAKNRVAVTSFSSNVSRIAAVARAAQACGRDVVVVGRAMRRVIDVAQELGYLNDGIKFLDEGDYGFLPRERVLLLLTGSQGEARAALARIARDEHRHIALAKDDMVIFSSRAIPGNEKEISAIINQLTYAGVQVVTDNDASVHVTGHPRRNELREMYKMVQPKALIPVHGEAMHLYAHAKLGRESGIKDVLVIENGHMVKLCDGALEKIGNVPVGQLYRDGNLVVDHEASGVSQRRKLSFAGHVCVSVAIDSQGDIVGTALLDLVGLPYEDENGDQFANIIDNAIKGTLRSVPKKRRKDVKTIREAIRRSVRAKVNEGWGKKPLCTVMVHEV